ncbi:alpha/beta hydrolase [Streptomyces sp. URMC 126]|uniref:alpha/beta hydrolase n=1 Tax=Streptomyces sp. URMC 126 TaxID=3423401 RepID=UPI003F1BBED7
MAESETTFRSLDGTTLTGTLTTPDGQPVRGLVILAHGAGVTREEGGFFTRLATGLAAAGFRSLRFDLRAHGASAGRPEDVTIAGVANDIRAASDHLRAAHSGPGRAVDVIAASFSGGAAALHTAHRPRDVRRLVLLNPRLDYHERYATSRPYVTADYLTPEAAETLDRQGYTEHSPFALGRALLNEVHHLDPASFLRDVQAPTLLVHGTKDTFVPVESSRHHLSHFGGPAELLQLDGAQHGFAVHDDPGYRHPQSRAWQAEVIERVAAFLSR